MGCCSSRNCKNATIFPTEINELIQEFKAGIELWEIFEEEINHPFRRYGYKTKGEFLYNLVPYTEIYELAMDDFAGWSEERYFLDDVYCKIASRLNFCANVVGAEILEESEEGEGKRATHWKTGIKHVDIKVAADGIRAFLEILSKQVAVHECRKLGHVPTMAGLWSQAVDGTIEFELLRGGTYEKNKRSSLMHPVNRKWHILVMKILQDFKI